MPKADTAAGVAAADGTSDGAPTGAATADAPVAGKAIVGGTMWTVYIIECADGSLYTGITNDLDRRLAAHAAGRGAKYTRGRGPFVLRHTEAHATRSDASKRERAIKALDAAAKRRLVGAAMRRVRS